MANVTMRVARPKIARHAPAVQRRIQVFAPAPPPPDERYATRVLVVARAAYSQRPVLALARRPQIFAPPAAVPDERYAARVMSVLRPRRSTVRSLRPRWTQVFAPAPAAIDERYAARLMFVARPRRHRQAGVLRGRGRRMQVMAPGGAPPAVTRSKWYRISIRVGIGT
jgi:hypothetical protein